MLALLLLIIATVTFAKRPTRMLAGFDIALALVLLYKSSSTTVLLAAAAVAGVWALAWFARRPSLVTRIGFSALIAGAIALVTYAVTNWTSFASALGKSPDLTNRFGIWQAVLERIQVRPITGFGFTGWWPTWEGWFGIYAIRNIRVQQAHNVWLDLAMQIGFVGTALFAFVLLSTAWLLWRHAARGFDAIAVITVGIVTAMSVQTLTESRILSEWGIAFLVILAVIARRTSLARTDGH
jgi:exopolysaccharide production protein ExoQ